MRATEYLPRENEKDKYPSGTLLETAKLKEITKTSKISWNLSKAGVFDL